MLTYRPLTLAVAALLAAASTGSATAQSWWSDNTESPGSSSMRADTALPTRFRRVALNRDALVAVAQTSRGTVQRVIALPLPEGGQSQFQLDDAGVLPPGLAARFPHLLSLRGQDAEGRRVRLDMTPDGVHASVTDAAGDWLVRPEIAVMSTSRVSGRSRIVFRRADAPVSERAEDARMSEVVASLPLAATARGGDAGSVLRTFRIAMSATGAYTEHMGGRVEDGLAGVVRTVNRVNEVFERDLGVHFVLAEGNDRIIFTHADDPFAQSASDWDIAMRNVEVIEKHVGKAAFDVGHALDGRRNAGVVGAIGNTCQSWSGNIAQSKNTKAAGMTGSKRPFEDAFHVDFVAHELGHQFGASHTFNGCQRHASLQSGFEPASGSTVMGYAGLCDAHDLQPRTDPYFHAASIEQVQSWLASQGGTCAKAIVNALPAPFLDTDGWHKPLVVPARTPFSLTGSASFVDPSARLTYAFEQMDSGEAQAMENAVADVGSGPLFRSRPPAREPQRSFPSMAVLTGDEALGLGDAYPQTSRDLHFRMTVRDNLDHRSHVVSADRTVKVIDTGAAFELTAPVAGAVLRKGKARQLRWKVAGTRQAPISCDAIRIDLSLDGGRSFLETPLAASVPNTGRASVTIPENTAASRHGLLRASCVEGAFFALSPGEVEIR